jgi:N-acetylglutamate synthase-like GNAT family acetyltransferase
VEYVLELQFRAARRSDLPKMAQLFTKRPREEREERMLARYEQDKEGWYVALSGDQVVGCCQVAFPRPTDAWLQWMRIAPTEQGGGIGGRFSDYIEAKARQGGARAVRLNTLPSNERVHYMMGGSRGFTEWARWTRMTRVDPHEAAILAAWRDVQRADDAGEVMSWLEEQVPYHKAFEAVTCPTDFRMTVSLDEELVRELTRKKSRNGIMVARTDGEIDGIALYAVRKGELRVLQVVAQTTLGGLAAVGGAVQTAKAREHVSIQLAGASNELVSALEERFCAGKGAKRHDFYVFGKRM